MTFNEFVNQYMWVPLASFTAIAFGTMSGGWKIVKTMGTRITKVTPLEGVAPKRPEPSHSILPNIWVFL